MKRAGLLAIGLGLGLGACPARADDADAKAHFMNVKAEWIRCLNAWADHLADILPGRAEEVAKTSVLACVALDARMRITEKELPGGIAAYLGLHANAADSLIPRIIERRSHIGDAP